MNIYYCYLSAIIALALLVGSFSILSITKEQDVMLRQYFSGDIKNKYEAIVSERRNHYIMGLVIGLIISFYITNQWNLDLNQYTRITVFTAITLMTAVIVYMVTPKSDRMSNYLKTEDEKMRMAAVSNKIQHRYLSGCLLGALAAVPLAYNIC